MMEPDSGTGTSFKDEEMLEQTTLEKVSAQSNNGSCEPQQQATNPIMFNQMSTADPPIIPQNLPTILAKDLESKSKPFCKDLGVTSMTETFRKGSENISELFKTTANSSQAFLNLPQQSKNAPQNPEAKFASDHTVTTKCYSDPLEEFALHADSINQFGTGILPSSTSCPQELINGRERATSETQNNGVSLVQGQQKLPQFSSESPLVSTGITQPNQKSNTQHGLSAL